MLMMVCGIVLGKAKTTKGCYELNIVNESMNELMTKVGIELLGQLKTTSEMLVAPRKSTTAPEVLQMMSHL